MEKPEKVKAIRKYIGVWMDEALYNYIQEQAILLRDTQSNVMRSLLLTAQRVQATEGIVGRLEALEARFERHIAAHQYQKGVSR